MTYRELIAELGKLNSEQLDCDVTVHLREIDEFYAVVTDYPLCLAVGTVEDRLDEGHPYLVI